MNDPYYDCCHVCMLSRICKSEYFVTRKKRSVLTRPYNVIRDKTASYRITEQIENIREPVVIRSHRKLVSSDHLFNGDIIQIKHKMYLKCMHRCFGEQCNLSKHVDPF